MSQKDIQKKSMIRSLVAKFDASTDAGPTILRNLQQPKIEQAVADGHLLWLDLVDPTGDELKWLSELFGLSPAVAQDLARDDRRPAMLVYPSYLFISLFEPFVRLDRVLGREIHCLVTDNCFITVRRGDLIAIDDAYNRVAQNPYLWTFGIEYLLYLTTQSVIDTFYPLLDRISNQLSKLEERLLEDRFEGEPRKVIYPLKQQLIAMRQMVSPQREVMSSMIGEKRVAQNPDTRDLFRHLYERLLRVYDIIDSQRDLASNVLDMIQNQEGRKLAEAVNRLTIFSMIFLPLTFLTGLFELNFTTTSNPFELPISGALLFFGVIVAMIVSAGIMLLVFRQRGWL